MPVSPDLEITLTERMFDRGMLAPEPPHATDTTPPLTVQAMWMIDTQAGTRAALRARREEIDLASREALPTLPDRQTVFDEMVAEGRLIFRGETIDFVPQPKTRTIPGA